MAQTDPVITVQTHRHLIEQYAYNAIRKFLSNQFILDPVSFMHEYGKRPEDLTGAHLRKSYRQVIQQGLSLDPDTPIGFKEKFLAGNFF